METFYSVILLMVASFISSMIYTKFDKIPLAFYQIASGLILALFPMFHNFTLSSELFISAVIAPILFNDGQNTNHKQLQRSIRQIVSMSVGLAVFTALALGILGHLMLPIIPTMLTLALAAIITPTDAVALSSITQNLKIPFAIKSNLKNESLFNDASGIVIFHLALTGFITGNVSVFSGFEDFVISFVGGLTIGFILGFLAIKTREWMVGQSMDAISVVIPFNLVTPIAIFSIAEVLHASGILAVVAAGIVQGIDKNQMRLTAADIQIVSKSAWNILTDLLNGFTFVLLGVILPTVVKGVFSDPKEIIIDLTTLSIVMYLIMFGIRFAWVGIRLSAQNIDYESSIKDAFITAISGIHGTITLSMALSIPLTLNNKEFPFRNEIIFVSLLIILMSLIIPMVILPQILPKKNNSQEDIFVRYRSKMVNYGIRQLKEHSQAPLVDLDYVIDMLSSQKIKQPPMTQQVRLLMRTTVDIEKNTLKDLVRTGQITAKEASVVSQRTKQTRNLSFSNRLLFWIRMHLPKNKTINSSAKEFAENYSKIHNEPHMITSKRETFRFVENRIYENILEYLDEIEDNENQSAVFYVRRYYNLRHKQHSLTRKAIETRNRLFIHAFKYEFNFVLQEYTENRITQDLANRLNHSISTDQLVYMQSIDD